MWFAVERTLSIAFVVLLGVYLVGLRVKSLMGLARLLGPLVPLIGLGEPVGRRAGGAEPADYAGSAPRWRFWPAPLALGSALTGALARPLVPGVADAWRQAPHRADVPVPRGDRGAARAPRPAVAAAGYATRTTST